MPGLIPHSIQVSYIVVYNFAFLWTEYVWLDSTLYTGLVT